MIFGKIPMLRIALRVRLRAADVILSDALAESNYVVAP